MFNELKKSVLGDFDVKLNISMKGETISVSFVPTLKAGSTAKQLKPIIVAGSADDLDSNFLQVIQDSFMENAQLIYDVTAFTASLEKAKKETEEAAKKETKKAEPTKPEAKKESKKTEKAKSPAPELISAGDTKEQASAPVLPVSTQVPDLSTQVPDLSTQADALSAPVMKPIAPLQETAAMDDFGSVDDLLNDLSI